MTQHDPTQSLSQSQTGARTDRRGPMEMAGQGSSLGVRNEIMDGWFKLLSGGSQLTLFAVLYILAQSYLDLKASIDANTAANAAQLQVLQAWRDESRERYENARTD